MVKNGVGSIFILEEDLGWRRFAAQTLSAVGYPFRVSADVYEFLALIEQEEPAMIMVGVSTIGERELQIIDSIVQRRPTCPLVVAASSLTGGALRAAFVRGAADVARKSFVAQELLSLVQAQLEPSEPVSNYLLRRFKEGDHG